LTLSDDLGVKEVLKEGGTLKDNESLLKVSLTRFLTRDIAEENHHSLELKLRDLESVDKDTTSSQEGSAAQDANRNNALGQPEGRKRTQ
jgi:hypothetical protein